MPVSAAASNFRNDSHARRLSLGFPEIQGLFQTLVSVCDMSDSVCITLGGEEAGRTRSLHPRGRHPGLCRELRTPMGSDDPSGEGEPKLRLEKDTFQDRIFWDAGVGF